MPEIRIDRISSGSRLLIILSKERERVDVEACNFLIKVAINTAITSSIKAVPNPLTG
jgi:hypothetical protein